MKILSVLLLCALSTLAQARDFSRLYEKVADAVVTLTTKEYVEKETRKGLVRSDEKGLGSGVLLKNGYILTASHVVHIADRIDVELRDGRHFSAKPISTLPLADLALIRIEDAPKNLPFAKLGNSDKMKIGEEVFVVGAPYGLSQTLTTGNFSGRRVQTDDDYAFKLEFLQTDAPINRGNSGGPMFNLKGNVIGIVSHIRTSSGGSEGLGFAASIQMARELLLDTPPIWSGLEYIPLNPTLAEALNSPSSNAILIQRVAYGSLGDNLGLQPGRIPATILKRDMLLGGDIVLTIGGLPIKQDPASIRFTMDYINAVKKGDDITVEVFREGKVVTLTTPKN